MNDRMHAKIECCLELSNTAADFQRKVIKVTGISLAYFRELPLTADTFKRLEAGETPEAILKELF